MMSIVFVFWSYVIVFAVIGLLRGWAKELLVSFSVIIALALNYLLRSYVPIVNKMADSSIELFWSTSSFWSHWFFLDIRPWRLCRIWRPRPRANACRMLSLVRSSER